VPVEEIDLKPALGGMREDFEVELLVAEHDHRSAVGRFMMM